MSNTNIIKEDISSIAKDSMLEFFLNLMYSRAIGDIRDGLKPVHKRIIHGSKKSGMYSNKPYRKSASIVGSVMGTTHPHGDASLYEAAVRMTQDFSLNIPMMDGYGNMGNAITGDGAASMRYTEIRLSKYAERFLLDGIDKNAVDMVPTFDNMDVEPEVLPAKTLNLLINGSMGIGGGYAQHIPTHNVNEVCDMIIKVIEDPEISIDEIANGILPDFPTGGYLCSRKDIVEGYKTGRGNVRLRANAKIENNKIIVTDMPYGISVSNNVNKKGLVSSIADAVKSEKITGISTLHDYSDKSGVNLEINIKKGYDPEVILNQLYKYTLLEYTVKIILVCKNGNSFKEYNIKEIFTEWLEFRRQTLKRIFIFDIKKYKLEMHELEGIVIALNDIDNIIKIIKNSPDENNTYKVLNKKYGLTDVQIKKILSIRLTQLHKMERVKLLERIAELKEIIKELTYKLSHPNVIDEIIIEEQKEIKKLYGRERQTEIREIDTNIEIEDMITDEETSLIIDYDNTIKRTKLNIKTQNRNTKGKNIDTNIKEIYSCNLKDYIFCFTNQGRVYSVRVFDIKELGIKANGINIGSYVNLRKDETVTNIFCITTERRKNKDLSLIFATKKGLVKSTSLDLFKNLGKSGLIAISLSNDDELLDVKLIDTKEKESVLLTSSAGNVIRFNTSDLKNFGRDTKGLIGLSMDDGVELISMNIIKNKEENNLFMFFATKNGLGKRVRVMDMNKKKKKDGTVSDINDGFPIQLRSSNSKGRLGLNFAKGDKLISSTITNENSEIMVVTKNKMLAIKSSSIPVVKRPALGSKLVDLEDNDEVININVK